VTVRFDAARVASADDPHPYYATLRAAGPVVAAGPGTWAVTRYDDVSRLLVDRRLSHEYPDVVYASSGEPDEVIGFFRAIVLNRDPPRHTLLRRAMAQTLNHASVARLRPRVDELVAELFDALAGREDADLVTGLAEELPVTVAAEWLGIPPEDRSRAHPHAMALSASFGAASSAGADRTPVVTALRWLRDYVGALVRERAAHPSADALSQLLAAAGEHGGIDHDELVDNVIFLFFAGFETTTNFLSTGCAILLERPDLLAALTADPGLATSAVEEFLRYDAPVHATSRVTLEPVEIGGRRIRAGRLVLLLLGSANRDERRFPAPDVVDIARSPNPHLGFSSGTHHCLGAALARVEGAAVFSHVARRLRVFEPAGDPVRRRDTTFRGYERLPVRVRVSAGRTAQRGA
jgi:cytochrome P450